MKKAKKKIIITGGTGLVGSSIVKTAKEDHNVLATWHSNTIKSKDILSERIDITNAEDCQNLVERYNPDCVIHTAIDFEGFVKCEKDTEEKNRRGIVDATINTLDAYIKIGTYLIYISSSDWVFDGEIQIGSRYLEDDNAIPICNYGRLKLKLPIK